MRRFFAITQDTRSWVTVTEQRGEFLEAVSEERHSTLVIGPLAEVSLDSATTAPLGKFAEWILVRLDQPTIDGRDFVEPETSWLYARLVVACRLCESPFVTSSLAIAGGIRRKARLVKA